MKIKLNLYIFLFWLMFLITKQIKIYTVIMIFAFIHELAHLICGIILGFKPDTLRIMPLGFSIEFKTKVEDYNKKILKSNINSFKKIIIALIPFGILWLAYGISGLLAPKLYSYIIEAIFGITFATVAIDTGFILLTKDHKKHINGIKSELSTAYQLREEINQKLSKIKKESKDLTTTNIEDSQKTKTNDIVVLKDTTPFYEEMEKQLDESYTKGYKQKVKILTLNKKNKV